MVMITGTLQAHIRDYGYFARLSSQEMHDLPWLQLVQFPQNPCKGLGQLHSFQARSHEWGAGESGSAPKHNTTSAGHGCLHNCRRGCLREACAVETLAISVSVSKGTDGNHPNNFKT